MVLLDLAEYLMTQGLGTGAVDLFVNGIPQDAPNIVIQDAVMGLIDVPGLAPLTVHDDPAPSVEQPVVQVETRGMPYGYSQAYVRAHQALVALSSVHNQVLSGTFYQGIQPLGTIWKLKTDDQNRPYLVFRVLCKKAL